MKIVDRDYVDKNSGEIVEAIKSGKIFIYPTDTIYGLGCNALLDTSVGKIREIKNRDSKPFSIIAPNKDWIEEHCVVTIKTIDKFLPGPYTLIVKVKTKSVTAQVNQIDDTLGVRIPKHWFTNIIAEAGVPFVTTSVNLTGVRHMEKLEDLSPDFLEQIDYTVYEGEKKGKSSVKIDLI